MPPHNVAALVHLVGFLTGAALYAMLFALVLRRRMGGDRLPLGTAVLGLIWNASGLAVFGIRDFAGVDPPAFLIATAYSALGFLPAVVVHSVLRSQSEARHKRMAAIVIASAYTVSTVAETLMFWTAFHGGQVPSAFALQLLTWFYLGLTIPLFLLTRRRTGSARAWSIVALAVFAVSALHLSHREGATESWYVELAGHHASIPLIFAILYQDFRFALADLFLKRALALFALVAIASGLYIGIEVPLLAQHDFRSDPVAVGVSVILWVGLALLYPPLCRAATWIIDRVVLHRSDYKRLREDFDQRLSAIEEPQAVMDALVDALRAPLAANEMRWVESDGGDDVPTMIIPTTELPRYALVAGPLAGGRRLLSDDLEMLNNIALLAARRIDAIRLSRERYQQNKLTTEAELRALRAQVNPHFLFNALNTIGYLIQTSPVRAHETLMKLTTLLRGVLRSAESATTLGDEIDLVSAYLEIERARFEERLRIDIDVPGELRGIRVPALMIQPLVENAIKHGIANCRSGGRVAIESRSDGHKLAITVRNSGAHATDAEDQPRPQERRRPRESRRPPPPSVRRLRQSDSRCLGRRDLRGDRSPAREARVRDRLRIVVADDERSARSVLVAMLRGFDDVEIVGEATDGAAAVELIEREKPDLALLDLQMPEVDGIGVVRLLKRASMPMIAFVTAYDEYAVRAFELNAVDYLLKPVDATRLRETVSRAIDRLDRDDARADSVKNVRSAAMAFEASTGAPLRGIPVRRKNEIVLVNVSEVASIIADGELLHLTTIRGIKHTISYRLKDLEARLDREEFIRLSRGTLANISAITKATPMPGGTFVLSLSNGQELQTSRFHSRLLRERLLRL